MWLSTVDQKSLAHCLPDSPQTVISSHCLRRGLAKAWIKGSVSSFAAAIVQIESCPSEPISFGQDIEDLVQILENVQNWDCIIVDYEIAKQLGSVIESALAHSVSYMDDVYFVPGRRIPKIGHACVRELTLKDMPLLEKTANDELKIGCWRDSRSLLTDGIIAAAIVDQQIVATSGTAALSDGYAEIGVYTEPAYRRQGLALAAASLVVNRVQETGRVPVWSAGSTNVASIEMAKKLGFKEYARRTYVILDRIEA
ncbi:putative acyltransferase [Leptolyngbya sp. PCC 7375]|nr:putative acyltransferase [Leptolyngbya sp. PCC 7375]